MQHQITLSSQEASDALKEYFRLVKGINIQTINYTITQNCDMFDRPVGGMSLSSVVLIVGENKVKHHNSLAAQYDAIERDTRPFGDH